MFSTFDFGCHITVVWQCNRSPSQSYLLGSLSNHGSHSSENVTWKVSSRCFKIYYFCSISYNLLLGILLELNVKQKEA